MVISLFVISCSQEPEQEAPSEVEAVESANNFDGIVDEGEVAVVEYEGRLSNGDIFDDSSDGPLIFQVGKGGLLRGFELGVQGMKLNEEKDIFLEATDAYGDKNPQLITEIPKEEVGYGDQATVGAMLTATAPDGRQMPAHVIEVTDDTLTIDLNHPLAGEDLLFHVKLVEIR